MNKITTFFSEISEQTLKLDEKIVRSVLLTFGIYEENPSRHHGGMHTDRQSNGQMDYIYRPFTIFPDSSYSSTRKFHL